MRKLARVARDDSSASVLGTLSAQWSIDAPRDISDPVFSMFSQLPGTGREYETVWPENFRGLPIMHLGPPPPVPWGEVSPPRNMEGFERDWPAVRSHPAPLSKGAMGLLADPQVEKSIGVKQIQAVVARDMVRAVSCSPRMNVCMLGDSSLVFKNAKSNASPWTPARTLSKELLQNPDLYWHPKFSAENPQRLACDCILGATVENILEHLKGLMKDPPECTQDYQDEGDNTWKRVCGECCRHGPTVATSTRFGGLS